MPQTTKQCPKCCQSKPLFEFKIDLRAKDGRSKVCLACAAAKHGMTKSEYEWKLLTTDGARQEYYINNQSKRKRTFSRWVIENRSRMNEHSRKYHRHNPQVGQAANHRRKARMSNTQVEPFSEKDRLYLVEKYNGCCVYCGCVPDKIEMDHVTPLCRGGKHTLSNVVPSCFNCNRHKAGKLLKEVGMTFAVYPYHIDPSEIG